ncbi:MAG: 16S rRNA (guanine(527)-N(7))-methyltransferase RsmG [Spirochaetia bacterium]|nr:16S rRNA (guanine(527)-N(7))-methyltransferase RsmG [Spirochaetia bacterium]MBQ6905360.1 16S rRNA (guanine(527)-N(7))-methyltransferase RsmG [Spirochaetia bacterium]
METLLDKGLGELGISFSDAQCRQLETYWSELAFWNGKYGLVNASGDELVIKHFLDSLAAVPVLREIPFRTACDVGSGGGFPGLVLAIAFPDRKFTLIERSGKKALFLANTAVMMHASNVEVLDADAGQVKDRFDLVLFRALGQFAQYFPVLYRLASPYGHLFAFKGRKSEIQHEIQSIDSDIQNKTVIRAAHVPFMDDERNFVIIER